MLESDSGGGKSTPASAPHQTLSSGSPYTGEMRLSSCLTHPLPFTHPRLRPPPVLTSRPVLGLLNWEGKKKLDRESETATKPLT